jgi:hypothetical protein
MTTFTLQTKIKFGKYKTDNVTVGELIESNPDYIAWCTDEIEWFELDDEAEKELDAAMGIGEQWHDTLPGWEEAF